MDLYLVLDLSISVAECVDYEKCPKVQRAFNFAEHFVNEIDKSEVSVHLVSLVRNPVLVKESINDSSQIRTLFKKSITSKDTKLKLVASNYKELCALIAFHKRSYNFEVLVVTDLAEEIAFPPDFRLQCLVRFVILTNFNNEDENLSENLVAALECISLNCGLDANFASTVEELNGELHFPLMIGDFKDEIEMADVLSKEVRTIKDVEIVLSPTITLKATLSPGLPKRLVIIDEEMTSRQIMSDQSPVFKFVGSAPIDKLVKLNCTPMTFEVCPRDGGTQMNIEGFHKFFDALIDTKAVAILLHSNGEECYLRPLKFENSGDDCTLIMQFYATSVIEWRSNTNQQPFNVSTHKFSYKPKQLYWNDFHDAQSEVADLCRKLKKETNPKSFYEDLYTVCEFAVACGFTEFAQNFAQMLEKKARTTDLMNNPHLIKVLEWLKSPDGFGLAANESSKLLQILSQNI